VAAWKGVPGGETRQERPLLPADGQLTDLVGADGAGDPLAQFWIVLVQNVLGPGVAPDGRGELLGDELEGVRG
jgi:hypothetical protein